MMIRGSQCPRGGSRVFQLAGAVLLVLLAGSLVLPQTAAAAGTWSATGSLVTGRYGHTATLLPNGKVLVAGGYNGGALTSAELYDPATGTWSPTGSLTYGRSNHTATLLNNGKVLVAGGGPTQCELYDPADGDLEPPPAPAPLPLVAAITRPPSCPTARSWWRGAIDVINRLLNSAELYRPGRRGAELEHHRLPHQWSLRSTRPPSCPTARSWWRGAMATVTPLNSAELFDPAANGGVGAWSTTGSLAAGRAEHTATLLPNGKVLVTGGYDASNRFS